ncbi:MAG: 30S ribosomal protein S16 [Parcubacteria group bacterium GW2011_GWA2_42_18]|nr:MAG: 30S ribosomal protein S16 [Parcubacteria group bacterium GW2011_GWA2_42_18]
MPRFFFYVKICHMLKLRLSRVGRRNDPHFRVVVTDSKNAAKSGKFFEIVGSYNARAGSFQVDAERVKHWLTKGVKPSDTVHNFLVSKKIIEDRKKNSLPRKSPTKKRKELKTATTA